MTTRTGRHRRHHPYDTPFRHLHAQPHAPATDRTGAWIFMAIAGALTAAVAWAELEQLFR